jgi:hypothetical protein
MSTLDAGNNQQRERARRGAGWGVTRFFVIVSVIVLIQFGLEALIFGEVGPSHEFQNALKETLATFDPTEFGKLVMEAQGGYEEPIAQTPEYRACMEVPIHTPEFCREQARRKREALRPDPKSSFNIGPLRLAVSVWNVIVYQFTSDRTPAFRLVALCQILVGFSLAFAIGSWILSRPYAPDINWIWAFLLLLIGGVVCCVLAAIPLQCLALWWTKPVIGVYSATGLAAVNKTADGVMHKVVERIVDAIWK